MPPNDKVEQTVYPNKWWGNFFEKFKEIDTLHVDSWKHIHILAYICKRHSSYFGRTYAFTFKGAPSSCPEMFLTKSIFAALNTTSSSLVKEYIDWVWDKLIIPQNKILRSIGYFNTAAFINQFLGERKEKNRVTRTTELPSEWQPFADYNKVYAQTYGDLVMIYQALKEDSDSRENYQKYLNQLYDFGLEENILKELGKNE